MQRKLNSQLELRSWWVVTAATGHKTRCVWKALVHLLHFFGPTTQSQPQSRPGLTSSRGSTLIFEQRTLATLESFFVLRLTQLLCSALFVCCCWLFKDQLSQTKHMASQAKQSACGMRLGLASLWRICVCVAYKFSLWLLPNQQKNFRIV